MGKKLAKVLIFILAIMLGLMLGAFLMYGYMNRSGNAEREPRTQAPLCAPGSDPDVLNTEPFLLLPAEHGIYMREYAGKEVRDDTNL